MKILGRVGNALRKKTHVKKLWSSFMVGSHGRGFLAEMDMVGGVEKGGGNQEIAGGSWPFKITMVAPQLDGPGSCLKDETRGCLFRADSTVRRKAPVPFP